MEKQVTLSYLKKQLREHGKVEFSMFDKKRRDDLNSSMRQVSLLLMTATDPAHLERDYLNEAYSKFAGKYSKDQFAFSIFIEE